MKEASLLMSSAEHD